MGCEEDIEEECDRFTTLVVSLLHPVTREGEGLTAVITTISILLVNVDDTPQVL